MSTAPPCVRSPALVRSPPPRPSSRSAIRPVPPASQSSPASAVSVRPASTSTASSPRASPVAALVEPTSGTSPTESSAARGKTKHNPRATHRHPSFRRDAGQFGQRYARRLPTGPPRVRCRLALAAGHPIRCSYGLSRVCFGDGAGRPVMGHSGEGRLLSGHALSRSGVEWRADRSLAGQPVASGHSWVRPATPIVALRAGRCR